MIPKIIHYCWFGGNPLPELAQKCINSWRTHCKGYEIIEWNEKVFNIETAPLYVRQAYENKKWAFVSDYVRLYALVTMGGVYLDTDVEIIKPIDVFLVHRAFSGFETVDRIPTGIMSCEKGYPLFSELLSYYDNISFIKQDGSLDLTTNVEIITKHCIQLGLIPNNQYQVIMGFALYPNDFFCPKDSGTGKIHCTENTYTIHHFSGSWISEKDKKEQKRYNRFISTLGSRYGEVLYVSINTLKEKGFVGFLRKVIQHISHKK